MLGHEKCLALAAWPEVDPGALVVDSVTVVFQENGKLRERIDLPSGLTKEELRERVLNDEKVSARLAGKTVVKVVVVPDKLVNAVVKG